MKKIKPLITTLIVFLFTNLFFVNSLYASTVNIHDYKIHSATSPTYGFKSFGITVDYNVATFDGSIEGGSTYTSADTHDYYSFLNNKSYGIGAGAQDLWSAYLLNSSGSTVSSTTNFTTPYKAPKPYLSNTPILI